jgi:predicted transcriptional regulator
MLPYSTLVKALETKDLKTRIGDVMQSGIKPVSTRDSLIDVQKRMTLERIDALPVVDRDMFLGMITSQDLNEAYRLSLAIDKSDLTLQLQEG